MPITLRILIFPVMLLIATSCSPQQTTIEADYIFENVNVVPFNEEVILPNQAVAVRDGKIVAVVDQSLAGNIIGEHIDGAERYLMPGLTDMHIHMRMDPQAIFNLFLANGVTTVVNMGLADGRGKYNHLQLRADVAEGRMDGPRYLVSGPQLTSRDLPTVAEVEPVLESHVEKGYNVIKIHGDLSLEVYEALIEGARKRGLRITGHAQHLLPFLHSLRMDSIEHIEEFLYVSRKGFDKSAAESVEGYLRAYSANLELLADPDFRVPIVNEVAASGIYIDPTLIIYSYILSYVSDDLFAELPADENLVYLPKSTREEYLDPQANEYRKGFGVLLANFLGESGSVIEHMEDNIELLSTILFELHQAGVPMLLGSDSFGAVVPGFSIHQELELMVAAGLTPYEALRTGTVNVAAYLGETDTAGTVEVGKRADFILVADNPLIDVRNASVVLGVFSHGNWYSETDLAALLAEAKALSASTD